MAVLLSAGSAAAQGRISEDIYGMSKQSISETNWSNAASTSSAEEADPSDATLSEQAEHSANSQATAQKIAPRTYAMGSIAGGWGYIWADQGSGERSNINGWFLKPSYNLSPNWSVYLDFSNYYGKNGRGAINQHSYTAGVSRTFPVSKRFKPGVFVQSGDVRVSNAGRITHAYTFLTGVSVTVPLKPWLAFSAIPAEYVFGYPNGQTRNSYNAKASLVFSFGHKGRKQ